MPATNLRPTVDVSTLSRAEVVSLGLDVHKEVLNAFVEGVYAKLTGPDPKPVFIPQIDPGAQIYRGLLLVPHG